MGLVRMMYFIVSLLYIYTGMRVLVIDRNNRINRIFFAMTCCLGVWSVSLLMLTFISKMENIITVQAYAKIAKYSFYASILYLAIYTGGLSKKLRLFVLSISFVALAIIIYLFVLNAPEFLSYFPQYGGPVFLSVVTQTMNNHYILANYIMVCLSVAFVVFVSQSFSLRFKRKEDSFFGLFAVFLVLMVLSGYFSIKEIFMPFTNNIEYSVIIYSAQILIIYFLIAKNEFFLEKGLAFSVVRTLDLMQEAFLITSEDYIINKANEEVEKISGYYIHQLYGMDAKVLLDDVEKERVNLICADGSKRMVTLSKTQITDPETKISFRILCFRDIEEMLKMENELQTMNNVLEERVERRRVVLYTIQKQMEKEIDEKKKLEEELSRLVYYDMLTELYNRVMFRERLQKLIQYERSDMAVLAIDIDNFKRINDTFGHNEGDRILIELADLIRSTLRAGEIAARLEGDEFLILYNKIYAEEDVQKRAEELREVVKNNFYIKDFKIHLTICIGVAFYASNTTAQDLIYNANVALYSAKLKGISGFEIYTKNGRNYLMEKINIRKEIERAIRENEFELYYQPQVLLQTGKIKGTEALIRWNHPSQGIITPSNFIPQIENENLIIKLGEWVIKNACLQIKEWEKQNKQEFLPVSVNLSMRHFETEDILVFLKEVIAKSQIDANNIKLEITESFRSSEISTLQNILEKIREEKISLSVDDFGTGYSSFHYLKHIKADILKIPREYITEIGKSSRTEYIVRSMIELAHDLNMTVIAEGVETLEEKEFLEQSFCDSIQGYYYYKPMKKEMLENMI